MEIRDLRISFLVSSHHLRLQDVSSNTNPCGSLANPFASNTIVTICILNPLSNARERYGRISYYILAHPTHNEAGYLPVSNPGANTTCL